MFECTSSPVSIGQLPYFSNRKQFDQMFQSFYSSNLACSNDVVWKQNSKLKQACGAVINDIVHFLVILWRKGRTTSKSRKISFSFVAR